jgi:DNA-binding transcriptional LysR family regulator
VEVHTDRPQQRKPHPLQTLNLNLLVPLEALLRRRSVSRAAEDLRLGQPSMSESLAKLRRHFGDELLERRGHELILTPFAAGLLPAVENAVRSVRAVFDSNAVFDRAESAREFVIAAADVWVQAVAAPLWRAVHQQAPRVRLDFHAVDPAVFTDPLSAARSADFVISPHGWFDTLRYYDLFSADWVFVAWEGNECIGDSLTVGDLREQTWVGAYGVSRGMLAGPLDFLAQPELRRAGITPAIAVKTESFLNVPQLVRGTDHIALMHRSHAEQAVPALGLRILESPVPLSPLTLALWWHPDFDDDPGHQWLRELLRGLPLP